MPDWEKLEARCARWANIIAALPGLYCGYVLWEQRHTGSSTPTNIPGFVFAVVAFAVLICIGAVLNFLRRNKGIGAPASTIAQQSQSSALTVGIPSLSGLLGQDTTVTFNPKKYFATAYYSPITSEVERNITAIAQQFYPNEKEAFYARFIGVGAVALQHELTWSLIFKSQLDAMDEMSSRGLIPLANLQKYYDEAAKANPQFYGDYPFDKWIEFMKWKMLIATYPTLMVELSWNGKDFLRYMAHVGYKSSGKSN